MSDKNALPGNWAREMKAFASASGAVNNAMKAYHPDWLTVYTHFLGDALTAEWAAAKTNGTSAAVTVATSQLTMTVGTDNDGYAGQGFGLFWKGDNGVYFQSRQQYGSAITTAKMEIGFSDAIDDAGAVNAKATPTATATDFAVLVFDTDDNTELDFISQDTATVAARAENVYAAFAAATDFSTIFRAQNDLVGVAIGPSDTNLTTIGAGGAMQGGTLVTPWWFAQNRLVTNANWTFKVDWAICTGPRA